MSTELRNNSNENLIPPFNLSLKFFRDPAWFLDIEMNFKDFNIPCSSLAHKYFGSSLSISMNGLAMFDKVTAADWRTYYEAALSGESFSKQVKLLHSSGDQYYDIAFNPVCMGSEVCGILVLAKDITAYKKSQLRLNHKVETLNTFMYKATHDLRAPLLSLMGLVKLAEENSCGDSHLQGQYFSMIGKSVNKMDILLQDLVSLTKVSHGKLHLEHIDFKSMIESITTSLHHYPNFERIGIRTEIDEHDFFNDSKLLYSVLQNLIDNAIKYSRFESGNTPHISIVISITDKSAEIIISDNGHGIPAASLKKVFNMFYRATSVANGTGLGLYIVKTTIEKMKGKIFLSSDEKKGTSITVIVPNRKSCKSKFK